MFKYICLTLLAVLGLSLSLQAQVIQTQSAITVGQPGQSGASLDEEDEPMLPQEVAGDRSSLISGGKIPATATPQWKTVEMNFDSVAIGQAITCTYVVRNVGGQPLVIQDIKTRNPALKITPPAGPITTGAYGEIKVTYTPDVKGKFAEYITVFTNAEDNTTQLAFLGLAIQP